MLSRKLIILFVCLVGIYLGYQAPYTQYWLNTYIINPSNSISDQVDKRSVDDRLKFRYGNLYNLSKFIKKTTDTIGNKDSLLILLPPNAYLKAHNVTTFSMPDPSEFYYFTHLKSVWTTSPNVNKANWAVLTQGKNVVSFVHIVTDEQRKAILDSFNKYKPSL